MNKHQSNTPKKQPWSVQPPEHITAYVTDNMPAPVATEMLCRPSVRMTNRERKTYQDARAFHFVTTRERKPEEEKLAAKLKTASMNQIGKWLKRVISGRVQAQQAFVRIQKHEQTAKEIAETEKIEYTLSPLIQRAMAALELKAAQFDIMREHLEAEISNREQRIIDTMARRNALALIS